MRSPTVGQADADDRHADRPVDRLEQLHPQPERAGRVRRARSRGVYAFVLNKWYFDELYDFLFVRPALWLGRLFWKRR